MNIEIKVTLSGEGADRRSAVKVEDALAEALGQLRSEIDFPEIGTSYPNYRNGALGFVLTAGSPPERKPRIAVPKAPVLNSVQGGTAAPSSEE